LRSDIAQSTNKTTSFMALFYGLEERVESMDEIFKWAGENSFIAGVTKGNDRAAEPGKGEQNMGVYSKFNRPILVVAYDPQWPILFEREKEKLMALPGSSLLMVEHMGSTSVPGLAAKPVIDIGVGMRSLAEAPALMLSIESLGYAYEPALEQLVPERRFFWKGTPIVHTYHLHLAERDHPVLVRPLQFRNYLRRHPEIAESYGELKKELAKRCGQDMDAYVNGKTAFIEQVMSEIEKESEKGRAL
jgi:GrpB-like predicted nucleotidyltransferase (UPF0157 family)